MPYRRRARGYRRRRGRRTAWYNKKYSTAQIARAAWRSAKYIRGLVNSEMFHHDREDTAINLPNTGIVVPLVLIAQGDGTSARTGNSILAKSLLMRMRLRLHSSATTTIVRYLLVRDRQQVADTDPTISDLLVSADVDSPNNTNTGGRFKILLNRTVALHSARPLYHKEFFAKMMVHIKWNGSTIYDIQKNGIYLVVISDQATNYPVLDLYSRLSYHDN